VIKTDRDDYVTEKVVLACGAWIPSLLSDLRLPLECERQVPIWFEPTSRAELFTLTKMPVFVWQLSNEQIFYGVPNYGDGVKVARHHGGMIVTPDQIDRRVTRDDETPVREFLKEHLPLANGRIIRSMICIYTNTPDQDFIIDFHPAHRNVVIISACSGHGFKFSSAIGEVASSLVTEGHSNIDIQKFALKRFVI